MSSLPTVRRAFVPALLLHLLLSAVAAAQTCPINQTSNGSIGLGDPVQVGRINRDGPPSDCGGPKTYPGTFDLMPRRFDQYTFTNNSGSNLCVQVTVDQGSCSTGEIYSAAYLGSFNPADVSQNYLGDAGDPPPGAPLVYSFNVPAGATFVVVVHELNAGTGCAAYTLNVGCGTPGAAPGQVLISEFRLSGPDAGTLDERDEFIELYNNTDAPLSIGRYQIRAFDPAFGDFTTELPPGATIPARGHYLIGDGGGYTLNSYAALDLDLNFGFDFFIDNEGFQLLAPAGSVAVIDSVGFAGGGNASTYVEGTGLTRRSSTPAVQYSYVRKMCDFIQGIGCTTPGLPKDTNNNAADFALVSVTGENFSEAGPTILGAPGPENTASPRNPGNGVPATLLDPTKSSAQEPNRVRNTNPVPNGPLGTLSMQRRLFNQTGAPITRMRFRVVELTTLNSLGGFAPGTATADLRVISSSGVVTRTDGSVVTTVLGMTLEQPPNQPNGGGLNSTTVVGTITPSNPLLPGEFIDVQFLVAIQRNGSFRHLVIVEAAP